MFVAFLFPCQALKKLTLLKQVEHWVFFFNLVTGTEVVWHEAATRVLVDVEAVVTAVGLSLFSYVRSV